MPVFEIESGGKTFEVEAPDQASALSALKQAPQQQPRSMVGATAEVKPTQGEDIALSASAGIKKGLIGLAGLPADLSELGARGLDRATRFIGDKLGAQVEPRADQTPRYGSAEITKAVEGYTGDFHKPQTRAGRYAETVGEFGPGLIGGPGGLLRRALTQVAGPGLASEAAGEATKGTAQEPYARIAAALGASVAPSALSRAVTPAPTSPARQRLVDILNEEGVTSITAGQRTGSDSLRFMESAFGDAPLAGDRASRITDIGQRQFTEAAMRRAGLGLPDASPEVLAQNQRRLGDTFRDLSARNSLQVDQQFGQDIAAAMRSYDRVPPSQQRAMVQGYVDDIMANVQANNGTMAGEFYQEARSRLSRQANSLRQSDPTLSEALRDIRNALDDAMSRSISPADREAWNTARREYGAQKVLEKAASRAGEVTAEGNIVPANLRNTVSAENRGAYARGEGPFSELARAGSAVMAPMPQSGTAPRSAIYHMLNFPTGGLLPAMAGRALMSRPIQDYLGNQLAAGAGNVLRPGNDALVAALLEGNRQRAAVPNR